MLKQWLHSLPLGPRSQRSQTNHTMPYNSFKMDTFLPSFGTPSVFDPVFKVSCLSSVVSVVCM